MSHTDWNPDQYERFRTERRQPFFDLLALVKPRPGMRVVDLGCGTGELTRVLHDRLQARETLGLDSSASMLERSRGFAGAGVRFEPGDLTAFASAEPYDLVFSNAALHWAPAHQELLRRLTALVRDGGQLAVQVPANHDQPSHVVAAALAAEEPFRSALDGYLRPPGVLLPEEYAAELDALGYREQHVRLQVYVHHLPSRDDVVEWVKGTTLVDYRKRLPPDLFTQFLERYRERLLPRLSAARPYFYPFKRILFWAQR
jgi:trans-aconitate 2-methyltransferase